MTQATSKIRVLSGVQPSGRLHLGNYFGAIQQHIALQSESNVEAFYFIANYHALTTVNDAKTLREATLNVALDYFALGLDPQKSTFFRQSDVPEVCELAWLLATVTGMGLLQRAHSYKDKVAQGITPSVGLFTYPILMAADILAPQANLVPVGQDQVQHVEMARDMAGYFNQTYGTVFTLPEFRLTPTAKVPGIDGRKMSKSYDNTLPIFESGKTLRKRIMAIVTDSTPVEAPKNPETCNLFALYALFADAAEQKAMAERYRAGGLGYGHVKEELYQKMEAYFAKAREERERLLRDPKVVEEWLIKGGQRARQSAQKTLQAARLACGLNEANNFISRLSN